MRDRAYRCLPKAIPAVVLLLVFAVSAAADESRGPGRAAAMGRAAACPACLAAKASCNSGCFALENKAGFVKCMIGCDKAAVNCTCDEQVTLRSEDILPRPDSSFAKADACHGSVSCQPDYPSCASWTTYFDCGDPFCGFFRWCPDDCEAEFGCFGDALRQKTERYRVCFNQFGQSCTEWEAGTNYVLGCGC